MPELEEEEVNDETARLAAWHIHALIQWGGFDTYWAGRIAAIHNVNIWQAVELHNNGCPQPLVEELLR